MEIRFGQRRNCYQLLFLLLLLPFLVGSQCAIFVSSGDNHDDEEDEDATLVASSGTLGAPPIAGVNYRSAGQYGVTNEQGQFEYVGGHPVQFSIGDIDLGDPTVGKSLVTISDLAGTGNAANSTAINIGRLLAALDARPENATVTITEEVRVLAQRSNESVFYAIEYLDFADNAAFANHASQLVMVLTQDYEFSVSLPDQPEQP